MLATAAFTIGCAQQLTDHVNTMITQLPFKYAEHNFYTAAKKSLSASLIWPDPGQMGLSEKPITDIIAQLLPLAARGLIAMGVDEKEAGLMEIIALRLAKKQNGASWQRSVVHQLERRMDRKSACTEMFSFTDSIRREACPSQNGRTPHEPVITELFSKHGLKPQSVIISVYGRTHLPQT